MSVLVKTILNFFIFSSFSFSVLANSIMSIERKCENLTPRSSTCSIREGASFITLNNIDIPFYSINNGSDFSNSFGTFEEGILLMSRNLFELNIWNGGQEGRRMHKKYSFNLVLEERNIYIFRIDRKGMYPAPYRGKKEIILTLRDVAPKLFNEIERLQNSIDLEELEYDRIHDEYSDEVEFFEERLSRETKRLNIFIDSIRAKNFDDLSEFELDEFLQAQKTLKKLQEKQHNLEKQIFITKKKIKNDVLHYKKQLDEACNKHDWCKSKKNEQTSDETQIGADVNESELSFLKNIFEKKLLKLKRLIHSNEKVEFIKEVNSWISHYNQFSTKYESNNQLFFLELKVLDQVNNKISNYVFGYAEHLGILSNSLWFKDSPVPKEIQKTIDEDIGAVNLKEAIVLKNSLQKWEGTLTIEQQRQLELIKALGSFYKKFVSLADGVIGFGKKLDNVLTDTIDSVKNGIKCTGSTVVLGDIGDFYEFAVGKNLCSGNKLTNKERAFSGLALIVGSSKLWRSLGELTGIASAKTASSIRGVSEKLEISSIDDINDFNKVIKEVTQSQNEVKEEFLNTYLESMRLGTGPNLSNSVKSTFKNKQYYNRKITEDEIYFKYHGLDNRTGKKVTWLVKKPYVSEEKLRSGVAILPEWDIKITKRSKFNVPAGTWVSEGLASPQKIINSLPGGDYQAVIENVPKAWILETVKAF